MSSDTPKFELIIGLGNPGKEYNNTWHNMGFQFVDELKDQIKEPSQAANRKEYEVIEYRTINLTLLKPLKFMNRSGDVVADFLKYTNIQPEEILIVHDDLDINLGEYKLQLDKFPKSHNGIKSIQEKTGVTRYYYLRIGIENRDDELRKRISGEDYVLSKIDKKAQTIIKDTLSHAAQEIIAG